MGVFRKLLRVLERIEISIAMMLFVVIVLSITAQVISRYGFGSPFVWVEEVSTYAFIWIVFLGAAVGMKRLSHIKIEFLSLALPERARSVVRLFGYVIMGFVLWHLLLQVPAVMAIESRSLSISLPLSRMWFYSVPLFAASASMSLTLIYYLLAEIIALANGRGLDLIDGTKVSEPAREGI